MVRLAVVLAPPARGKEQLIGALRFLALPTSFESGCLGCRVSTDNTDESLVRYESEWDTEEALRQHVRSERFTQVLEVLESVAQAPRVQFDFVAKTRGLDYVEEVRRTDGLPGTGVRA